MFSELSGYYRRMRDFVVETLGPGKHNVGTKDSPVYAVVEDGEVKMLDPEDPDADIPLDWALDYIERELGIIAKYELPEATTEEYEALKASIAKVGVRYPIIVDERGKIIDGHLRKRACDELKIECPYIVLGRLNLEQKKRLALELDACRKHFSLTQRRQIATVLLERNPRDSDRSIGRMAGLDHKTVGVIRGELVARGIIREVSEHKGRDGKTYKVPMIVTSNEKEQEKAQKAIKSQSTNGKIVDAITAQRRHRRELAKKVLQRRHQLGKPLPDDAIRLLHCRFQDLEQFAGIQPGTVNLVMADIPYQEWFLEQLPALAESVKRMLVEGGVLVVHCGNDNLDRKVRILSDFLTFGWQIASVFPKGPANRYYPLNLLSRWSPVLVYSKGEWKRKNSWCDLSVLESKDKVWHKWGKVPKEIQTLVGYFSNPGDLVVDPCGGGFTTAEACVWLNRRCISCDDHEDNVHSGWARIAEARKAMAKKKDAPAPEEPTIIIEQP